VTWRNWARTVEAEPGRVVAPETVGDLAALLAGTSGPVRVMGSSHSWSPLGVHDPGYTLLTLSAAAFQGLEGPPDAAGRVWVRAGTTLSALHGLLARHRRSLANVGSISAQTVAGIVATGTHGSGSQLPCLSALVSGVRFVTAAGEVREVTTESEPETLGFLQLSLGALGVFVALRLDTVPLFYVAERREVVPIDAAPEVFAERVAAEARTGLRHRCTWFAYAKTAGILSFEVVPAPEQLPEPFEVPSLRDRVEGRLLAEGLFGQVLLRATGRLPSLTPAVCRFAAAVRFRDQPTPRVGRLYERINEHGVPRHHETEWAVPLSEGPRAWRALRAEIERRGLPADFLQELRPAARDGVPLSAARDGDVCWLSLYQTTPHRWAESQAVAEDVLGGLGGRPHWGKSYDPARVRERVGAPFDAFEACRRRLDPTGRFLGPWHRSLGLG
jgi:FAD/FMN-containing dehydrogenase